jgi:signal transduction histidine kinase
MSRAVHSAAIVATSVLVAVLVDRFVTPPRTHVGAVTAPARALHDESIRRLASSLTRAADLTTHAPLTFARSAQLIDARGSVLASYEAPSLTAPACPPRVVERPTQVDGRAARLVVTLDEDCAHTRPMAPSGERTFPWAAMLAGLVGAALAAVLARRHARATEHRIGAFAEAVSRLGAGDLAVRVRTHHDDFDPLSVALNQTAEELALARERVEYLQRLAGWQDVARRLAHEIKNPLTPIQLAVQEVARKYEGDDARFKKTLDTAREVVEEEVATLRRLVTAFSEFARLPDVKPAPGDLAEFVRDMESSRAFLDEAAGESAKAVTVRFEAPDTPVPVMIDRIMLRRAFENLVRNAAQAIGARGGTVWVRCEQRHVDGVDQAWLVVEDDGPGVPKAHQAKVFDPYFTTKSEGTGLGLAIVRKIAIDHAGDVGLEDRAGGGARFVITLPLRDPSKRQRLSFVTFTRNPERPPSPVANDASPKHTTTS